MIDYMTERPEPKWLIKQRERTALIHGVGADHATLHGALRDERLARSSMFAHWDLPILLHHYCAAPLWSKAVDPAVGLMHLLLRAGQLVLVKNAKSMKVRCRAIPDEEAFIQVMDIFHRLDRDVRVRRSEYEHGHPKRVTVQWKQRSGGYVFDVYVHQDTNVAVAGDLVEKNVSLDELCDALYRAHGVEIGGKLDEGIARAWAQDAKLVAAQTMQAARERMRGNAAPSEHSPPR